MHCIDASRRSIERYRAFIPLMQVGGRSNVFQCEALNLPRERSLFPFIAAGP